MLTPQSVCNTFGRLADHWLLILATADGRRIGAQAFWNHHDAEQALRKCRVSAPGSYLAAVFDEPEVA